ncbi:MAG: RNA-binding S4 domain-containing protein [Alphaproteobacteria bacterium]
MTETVAPAPPAAATLRLDKFLWYARFCKSRTLASKLVETGRVRVNKQLIAKAHFAVRVDDVLTFPQGPYIRVVRIRRLGERRGPAVEAASLYEDLSPISQQPHVRAPAAPARRDPGAGRPTKADRRAIARLKSND